MFEDLGVQQSPNSTLCSYLNKLLWILTGNFAKSGGQHLHSSFGPLFGQYSGRTPVTGAPIIAGLVPSNVVPEEILTDHPDRFRAMIVESSNPAHSLADSAACRAAFQSLELMVVIDVAMTETARLAHYVLPAASQFEKPEATFFNLEFPHNTFQLRQPLLDPLPGTLPEPEIWARLVRALGRRRRRRTCGRCRRRPSAAGRRTPRPSSTATATNPTLAQTLPYVLYETLGPTLPDGLRGAAALWGLAQKAALNYPDAVRRAGHADGNALFDAILDNPSGVTFTVHNYEDDFALIGHADHKIALEIPEMLDELRALTEAPPRLTTAEFPIVLSVGERRAYTANDIFRDPSWRKRDADGALRVSVEDAQALGLVDGVPGAHHHRGRQRRGHRRDHRDHARRACRPAQRFWPGLRRRRRAHGDCRRRAQRAHVDGLARPVRGDAVAQARAGPDRALPAREKKGGPLVPDADPARRLQEQRVVLGHLEGVVEGVDVADDAVAPELRRRVRIDRQPPDRLGVAGLGAPHLGPADRTTAARRSGRR